jgi:hypothetical protein
VHVSNTQTRIAYFYAQPDLPPHLRSNDKWGGDHRVRVAENATVGFAKKDLGKNYGTFTLDFGGKVNVRLK